MTRVKKIVASIVGGLGASAIVGGLFYTGMWVGGVNNAVTRTERIEGRQQLVDDRIADFAGDVKALRVDMGYVKAGVDELRAGKTRVAFAEPTTRPLDE